MKSNGQVFCGISVDLGLSDVLQFGSMQKS